MTNDAPAQASVRKSDRVATAYAEGQRDALAEARWMHDKAWQDAVLMLVYYTDLDKRDARVTKAEAERGRTQAWAHCLKLSATRTAEDIAALSPPPTVGAGDETVALPESTELPPMTDRGIAGQIMDVAWPHYGGSNQPADFWHDFGEGVRFALHYTRPSPSAVEVKE